MAKCKSERYLTNFTIVPNEAVYDTNMSLEAKGLWLFFMAKPKDWVVVTSKIQKDFRIGRDKLRNIINELIELGYVERFNRKTEKQTWDGYDYIFHDYSNKIMTIKTETPETENPETENPAPLNQPLTNKVLNTNKDYTNISDPSESEQNEKEEVGENTTHKVAMYFAKGIQERIKIKLSTREIHILRAVAKQIDNSMALAKCIWAFLVQDDWWSKESRISVQSLSKNLGSIASKAREQYGEFYLKGDNV